MKKNNKKIKAPKYAFGAKEISGLAQIGGNIAQGFNTGNQTANAVFSGMDAVGDVASAINPIAGMAVKGVAGLGKMITGIVGTKGSVDPVTGEITKGTGIKGRRNRKKLIQQSGIVKNNIAAAENSQQLAADYYQENGYNDITMVANGGIIPNTLAYLDDGELIRTPDGSINEIPEEGKPEDSNLMNVPVGTQVLSDKLKVPGTNKTFAQKGKEIMKTNKYKGKDKYAENSKMLNDRNAQIAYDELLALQESIKPQKEDKKDANKYFYGTDSVRKSKWNVANRIKSSSDNPIYTTVTDTIPVDYFANSAGRLYRKDYDRYGNPISGTTDVSDVPNHLLPDYRTAKRHNPKSTVEFAERLNDVANYRAANYFYNTAQPTDYYYDRSQIPESNEYIFGSEYTPTKPAKKESSVGYDNAYYGKPIYPITPSEERPNDMKYWLGSRNYEPTRRISPDTNNTGTMDNNKPQYYAERKLPLFQDGPAINSGLMRAGWSHGNNTEYNLDYLPELDFNFMNKKSKNKTVTSKKQTNTDDSKQTATPKFKPIANSTPSFAKSMPDMGKINIKTVKTPIKPETDESNKFDVSDFISSLAGASAGLIGPIANMTAKRGETNIPYTYTPKYGPTEWNIDPQLREINRSNAIARYNQSRLSPNTGAGLAFGIQSAIARNDAMARAYAEKNNMENQMAMANAGIYNDAARYNAQARHTAAIENAQDRAAVDTARRTGLRDLGTALQTMSKDRRLSKRDQAVLAAMEPFLQYGMTGEQYQKLISLLG